MKSAGRRNRRSAAVTIELIIAMPVFLIFLAAIIQFGLIQANSQQLALAGRLGAKVAAESSGLNSGTTADKLVLVRAAVERQLLSAGIVPVASAGITLRHNVGGGGEVAVTDGDCSDPVTPALPANSVRVTVRVPLSSVTPDLLNTLGMSISGSSLDVTTTYAYEM